MVAQTATATSDRENALALAVIDFLRSDDRNRKASSVGVPTLAEYLRERRQNLGRNTASPIVSWAATAASSRS